MRLDLEEYNFTVEYVKGSTNVVADALSRMSFEDIKKIKDNSKILQVTTRAQARFNNNNSESMENSSTTNINININDKNIPRVIDKKNEKTTGMPILTTKITSTNVIFKIIKNREIIMEENIRISDSSQSNTYSLRPVMEKIDQLKLEKIKLSEKDNIFKTVSLATFKDVANSVLRKTIILIIPVPKNIKYRNEKDEIIKKYHMDPILGGHSGIRRTYNKIKQEYKWPHMKTEIANYINKCQKCQLNKAKNSHKERLTLTPTPSEPFHTVQIDTIGPLDVSESGNKYAITVQCELTKYLIIVPTKDKSAEAIAKALVKNVILIYGSFSVIKTDMGTEYCNQIFRELLKLFKTDHVTSTPYHHQSLGGVERSHRELNNYLRIYLGENSLADWDEWAKIFEFHYNTQPNIGHGYSPFELVFGRSARLSPDHNKQLQPIYNYDSYVDLLRYKLNYTNKLTKEFIERNKIKIKEAYDKTSKPQLFKVDDLVMIKNNNPKNKFSQKYLGPYTITEVLVNDNIKIINSTGSEKILHKDEIYKMKI
jgi:hypothetical protein